MSDEPRTHSTLEDADVVETFLLAAGASNTVKDALRRLEEQLEHSVEDVASLTSKNLNLIEQLEAAHRNMDRYGMALAGIAENGACASDARVAREALNPAKRRP